MNKEEQRKRGMNGVHPVGDAFMRPVPLPEYLGFVNIHGICNTGGMNPAPTEIWGMGKFEAGRVP